MRNTADARCFADNIGVWAIIVGGMAFFYGVMLILMGISENISIYGDNAMAFALYSAGFRAVFTGVFLLIVGRTAAWIVHLLANIADHAAAARPDAKGRTPSTTADDK